MRQQYVNPRAIKVMTEVEICDPATRIQHQHAAIFFHFDAGGIASIHSCTGVEGGYGSTYAP